MIEQFDTDGESAVAELQGLYGPFHFPELTLQKLWIERAYDGRRATTLDGERVVVDSPGRWNRLGGPDFREARIRIGDCWCRGDVEVHLHE